jgi:hypothetical protein
LRPEYQVPDEVKTQLSLAGISDTETAAIPPTEQKTLPKKPQEQLAAIRDFFRSNPSEWTLEQVVAQFKNAGRKKKVILQHLESLEFLGILISRGEENITY